jgi:hypothetical protein
LTEAIRVEAFIDIPARKADVPPPLIRQMLSDRCLQRFLRGLLLARIFHHQQHCAPFLLVRPLYPIIAPQFDNPSAIFESIWAI